MGPLLGDVSDAEEVNQSMVLRLYTRASAVLSDARARLHDRLVGPMSSERGAVAAEYALLIALIAVVIIAGATALGVAINGKLQGAADTIKK